MKKWLGGILIAGVMVGGSTAAFAAENGGKVLNFGQMLPYMQKMHPDLTKSELKDMYKACHGTGGSSRSSNYEGNNMMSQGMGNY